MSRKFETKTERLHYEQPNGLHLYRAHIFPSDGVTVHRFFVPDVDDEQVMVLGIRKDAVDENLLLRPAALLYLNRLLQWFSWPLIWGVRIQLDRPRDLHVEVTRPVERTYVESAMDEAYRAWRKKNPDGTLESFSAYALGHIQEGRLKCEIGSCHEIAAPGSLVCAEHQKFA